MSRPRATCLACGFEGNAPRDAHDRTAEVSMTVVKYADPVPVSVASIRELKEPDRRGYTQPQLSHRVVPGLYGAETRCTDVPACRERQAAMTTKAAPPRHEPEAGPA